MVALESGPVVGWVMVCVRFLRTQQRVKNRCQLPRGGVAVIVLCGWLWLFCFDYPLVDNVQTVDFLLVVLAQSGFQIPFVGIVFLGRSLLGGWGVITSTESLILAQDERWRRA